MLQRINTHKNKNEKKEDDDKNIDEQNIRVIDRYSSNDLNDNKNVVHIQFS